MIKRILLDMDGVLADFEAGAVEAHRLDVGNFRMAREFGNWNMIPTLSLLRGEIMSVEEFWRVITEKGERFWGDLDEYAWNEQLLTMVQAYCSDWHIISAPSRCPYSHSGKVKWIKARLGKEFDRLALTPHKEIFAQKGAILIDDRESNIEKFEAAGGSGILFPSVGNRMYAEASDPLDHVRKELERLSKCI